jgi:redox-sensitive bicupin YhaK (pirin superfamily)
MPQKESASFWGLQLWVNLPKRLKMTAPRYQDIAAERVPEIGPARTRVLAGAKDKTTGPVEGIVVAPTLLDVALDSGTFEHELPTGHACVAYVLSGTALVGATRTPVSEKRIAILGAGSTLIMRAGFSARVLVIAAQPIGEPVARRGPFVMSTEAELDQAYEDFRAGRLTDQSG